MGRRRRCRLRHRRCPARLPTTNRRSPVARLRRSPSLRPTRRPPRFLLPSRARRAGRHRARLDRRGRCTHCTRASSRTRRASSYARILSGTIGVISSPEEDSIDRTVRMSLGDEPVDRSRRQCRRLAKWTLSYGFLHAQRGSLRRALCSRLGAPLLSQRWANSFSRSHCSPMAAVRIRPAILRIPPEAAVTPCVRTSPGRGR